MLISSVLIPLLVAMFLAVNMGGSGTAPSFAAAYGANIIRKDLIPGLFGVFVFIGALAAGSKVSLTLGRDILPAAAMNLTLTTIVLLSVALSLLFANLLGIPQSTSQSTVFALAAPAVYLNSFSSQRLFFEIIPTWFILPILAFFITLVIGKWVYKPLKENFAIKFEELAVHPYLKYAVIGASCYVAFSIGANNVGNAAGPIASMMSNELSLDLNNPQMPLLITVSLLLIAPCFGIGSSILGHKVLETSGKDIIDISPFGATLISVITATLLLCASLFKGIPTSLVQLNIASIMGLGVIQKGWGGIFKDPVLRRFWKIWLVAPLFAFAISFLLTHIAFHTGLSDWASLNAAANGVVRR